MDAPDRERLRGAHCRVDELRGDLPLVCKLLAQQLAASDHPGALLLLRLLVLVALVALVVVLLLLVFLVAVAVVVVVRVAAFHRDPPAFRHAVVGQAVPETVLASDLLVDAAPLVVHLLEVRHAAPPHLLRHAHVQAKHAPPRVVVRQSLHADHVRLRWRWARGGEGADWLVQGGHQCLGLGALLEQA